MANYLTLVEQLSTAVDQLNQVLQGDETTTVDINGKVQPSVQKKTLDEVNAKIQLVLDAAADIDAIKYGSKSAGLSGTADGNYFSVVSDNAKNYLDLYKNESGVAVFKKSYPSTEYLNQESTNPKFYHGGIVLDTGESVGGKTRIKTELITAVNINVKCEVGKSATAVFYNLDGTYSHYVSYAENLVISGVEKPFKIIIKNNDNSEISPDDLSGVTFSFDIAGVLYIKSLANFEKSQNKNKPGGYVGLDDDKKIDIKQLPETVVNYSAVFANGSGIEDWADYKPMQIVSLKIWDREDSDGFYLNTLYRNYPSDGFDTASIGFKRVSDDSHICAAPEPIIGGDSSATYARWKVSNPLVGTQGYYLYYRGDTTKPPVGYVVVNWDLIPNTGARRYIGTDGSTPVITANLGFSLSKIQIVRANELPKNPLKGKKIVGLGDSITYGFIPRNSEGYPGQLQSWLPLVANLLEMTHENYGISGSTLANNGLGTRNPFTSRFLSMDDNADIIVVMGGTNDVRNNIPIGTMSDKVDTTFYGALHILCEGLINKYYIQQGIDAGKEKQIYFMTPIKLLNPSTGGLDIAIEAYVNAIKEVCNYYSIPVFDSYNLSNITPHILKAVQGTEVGYTGVYNPYITDGTHPTQQGHKLWAKAISGYLSQRCK